MTPNQGLEIPVLVLVILVREAIHGEKEINVVIRYKIMTSLLSINRKVKIFDFPIRQLINCCPRLHNSNFRPDE